MKKTTARIVVLALLLALLPLHPSAAAPGTFIAFNDVMLRSLTTKDMPRAIDAMAYVDMESVLFRHLSYIGIKITENTAQHKVIVYSTAHILYFDLANNLAYDEAAEVYPLNARVIDGRTYLPIDTVCRVFGLWHSFIRETPLGGVLRVSVSPSELSDDEFLMSSLEVRRQTHLDYVKYLESQSTLPSDTPGTSDQPGQPDQTQQGKRIAYLAFVGALNENTAAILDALDRFACKAAFFVTQEEAAAHAPLLREIFARGHTVGVAISPGDRDADALAAALSGVNEALKAALQTRVRLAYLPEGDGGTQEQRDRIIAAGFRFWEANVRPRSATANEYTISANVRAALRNATRSSVIELYGNENTLSALESILSHCKTEKIEIQQIVVWDTPINNARDLR